MAQLTIPEIIRLGDISVPLSANYESKGNIFGERMAINAPQTIALVTDALRWQWDAFPDVPEVRATATITITTTGDTGDRIQVSVIDPILGLIILGSYTLTDADTTTDIIATNIAAALFLNAYDYGASAAGSVVTVEAPINTGITFNGINLIYTITSPDFLSTQFNDRIITQNNTNIITQ